MQIGTRWSVGEQPPTAVPQILRESIANEEATLAELGADTTAWGWTLTFLEGSPVVECDDGTRIALDGDGVRITR